MGKHILQNTYSPKKQALIEDPKRSFAQKLAEKIGKGKVYALVGKGWAGGSMFKTDSRGKPVYSSGELIPANISINHGNKNTQGIDAEAHLKEFPL